jgi:hypothetical protein
MTTKSACLAHPSCVGSSVWGAGAPCRETCTGSATHNIGIGNSYIQMHTYTVIIIGVRADDTVGRLQQSTSSSDTTDATPAW